MAEESVAVVILLSNGNIPKDIFKSSVDEYFGPQVDDFKESSLSVCILSEKTGLVPSKSNTATFVKSQWFFLTNFAPDQIFEFKLVICDNNSWHIIRSEDSSDNRLIQTFSIPSDKAIVVHLEWNKPHTVSEESLMELLSMDESLIKSHYENLETAETFKNLATITEDHNDEESLLDSLQEEPDENYDDNRVDTDDSLEPGKEVEVHKEASPTSQENENEKNIEENEQNDIDSLNREKETNRNEEKKQTSFDSLESEKENEKQNEVTDMIGENDKDLNIHINEQNTVDSSEPGKEEDKQRESFGVPLENDKNINVENDQSTARSLEVEKEEDSQKEPVDVSFKNDNDINLDANYQNTFDSSEPEKEEDSHKEPVEVPLKNGNDINLGVNDQNTVDSSEPGKEGDMQKKPSDISLENDKEINLDENDQNTAHSLEPEKEVDMTEKGFTTNLENENEESTIYSLGSEKEFDNYIEPSDVSKENKNNQNDPNTIGSLEAENEGEMHGVKLTAPLINEKDLNTNDYIKPEEEIGIPIEKNHISLENECDDKTIEKNLDIKNVQNLQKEHKKNDVDINDNDQLQNSKQEQTNKGSERKSVLITKIQAILGIRSELKNIKQKKKDNIDKKKSDSDDQTTLTGNDILKESDPFSSDVIINNSGKFHEKVNFVSFAEETSPLMTSEKEVFAKEAIHSNNIESHVIESQNIEESEKNEDKISSLQINPIEESLQQSENNYENVNVIEEDKSAIKEEEPTDSSLIKIESNEKHNELLKEHLESNDQLKEVNNDQVENLRIEDISNMNEDISEYTELTKEGTHQPISCILVSPSDETKEIKSLESPEFSTAIENIHEEFDKLITIHSEVSPNNNSQLEFHSVIIEGDKNTSDGNEVFSTTYNNIKTSINHVEEREEIKDSDIQRINVDVIHKNPKERINNPKVEAIKNPKISKTCEKELTCKNGIKVESETNKVIIEENITPSVKLNVLREITVENTQEDSQPKVSDIIDKFETLKMRKESTGKTVVDKEKDKKRISDIVKLYEDINLNKEDVIVKPHTLKKNETPSKDDKEIPRLNINRDSKNIMRINNEIKITYQTQDFQNAPPIPTEFVERDISKESPTELRDNDDYKYPDSVTPTKVEQGLSQLAQYDVLFIDDDVFYKENWYKESNNRWTTLERSKITNNENSLTPASDVPMKNTPKASLETLNETEVEKIKVSIESAEPTRKKKGLMNLCGCVGGRKRS